MYTIDSAYSALCTSYYTPRMAYGIYCTRPKGAKHPRASAVNDAVRHLRCVVTSLSQDIHPKMCGLFEFSCMLKREGRNGKKKAAFNEGFTPKV